MFPWLYLSLFLLHSTVLTVWLWRWRRNRVQAGLVKTKDQHAYCASCGYDLTGRDVNKIDEIEAVQCPECGQTIQTQRDAVIPKHIKDKTSHKGFAMAVAGQAIFVVLMAWFFYGEFTDTSPYKATNTALINTVTQQSAAPPNISELYELDRRLDGGELKQAEELKLLSRVLAIQADPTKPWENMFGEWIEQGRAKGLVTDQQWRQYLTQPGVVSLACRKKIRVGEPVVLQLLSDNQSIRASYEYQSDLSPGILDDAMVEIYRADGDKDAEPVLTQEVFLSAYSPRDFEPLIDGGKPLPPGKYKVVVDTELVWPDPKQPGTQVKQDSIKLEAAFEVFPQSQRLIKAVKDDKLAAELQDAIYQELLRSGSTFVNDSGRLSVMLKDPVSSVAGSFGVSVDVNGFRSTTSWRFEANAPGNNWQERTFRVPQSVLENAEDAYLPFKSFSMRLTPNPEYLQYELEGYEYLDHTLWIRDIPMGLPEP
jgi:predicted RNA-binding Zn-ribbon protein involved in translation (DUF1610 family)